MTYQNSSNRPAHESVQETRISKANKLAFHAHVLNRKLFNTTLIRRRGFDGHIVSTHQSGFHWLKNMLSHILARHYNLPPITDIHDKSFIGHTKTLPAHANIPCIVHSHSHPHLLTLKIPFLHFPNYLILVREMKASLVAHYERFKHRYQVDFNEYLRGDVRQKKYHSDIYSRIYFMNAWGALLDNGDSRLMSVRYEDLQTDSAGELRKITDFFGINNVADSIYQYAVAENTREKMAKKQKMIKNTVVVRSSERLPVEHYFDAANDEFFMTLCHEYLNYDFGYGYLKS